jgi:molybdate transport system ATP-binding protein
VSRRLDLEIAVPLQRFRLEVAFETAATNVGLFGHSGAGKSTVLETIAGLRRGAHGRMAFGDEVWLDSARGIDRPPEERGIGYLPQEALLFPHWDVRRNILAGRRRVRHDRATEIDPDQVIDVLDLSVLLPRSVATLSGGERQRVALARALCSGPSLLLLDEPLGSIEASLRGRILHYLLAVRDTFRIPTLFVSHEATEVSVLCDEVIVLREGRVISRGKPENVFTAAPILKDLLDGGYENVLEGIVEEIDGRRVLVSIAGGHTLMLAAASGVTAGAQVLVGIRATEMMLAVAEPEGLSARNLVPGTIREIQPVDGGHVVRVTVDRRLPDLAVLVTESARRALGLAPGVAVRLVAKAQSVHLLALR